MLKLLKFIIPLCSILLSNTYCDITFDLKSEFDSVLHNNGDMSKLSTVENYLAQYHANIAKQAHYGIKDVNMFKPAITLLNPNINKYDTIVNDNEMKEFIECIKKNANIAKYSLMLSESLLNNYLNNISESCFVSTDKNINTWTYFKAMQSAVQKFIDENSANKFMMKEIFHKENNNSLLNDLAYLYIKCKFSNTQYKNIIMGCLSQHKNTISIQSILNTFLNFYKLGFADIINQVITGTLAAKEILQQINMKNKSLTDEYDKSLADNMGYFIKIENYDIGRCWFDAAFEIVYTALLNINTEQHPDIENTNIYKFIKFIEKIQKERAQEVKNKKGQEVVFEDTRETEYGIISGKTTRTITDQINIFNAFQNFEKSLKEKVLTEWNKQSGVAEAKNELHRMINENETAEKTRIQSKKNEAKKQFENDVKNLINTQHSIQSNEKGKNDSDNNSQGNSVMHGIDLLTKIFPELKKIFIPKYDVEIKNDKEIVCNYFQENKINSFISNQINGRSANISYLPGTNINIITNTNKLISNAKHMQELPEYMLCSGATCDGIKTIEKLQDRILGFTEKSELAIYELSSMAMSKSGAKHAYALYKGHDGWYIMDDHNIYQKLTKSEFDEIIKKDKVELFVYKKLFCKTLDEYKKQTKKTSEDKLSNDMSQNKKTKETR